jgi:hypothetical protein
VPTFFAASCSPRCTGYNPANSPTRNFHIAGVARWQVLEWWYTSAEEKLTPNVTLPIPPAPPVMPPHPQVCERG